MHQGWSIISDLLDIKGRWISIRFFLFYYSINMCMTEALLNLEKYCISNYIVHISNHLSMGDLDNAVWKPY